MEKKYKFSLRWKLVLFVTVLALITYTTSMLFISVFYEYINDFWNVSEQVFTVLTLVLGVFWSGVLAYFMSGFITRPLKKLERVVSIAAEGDLTEDIDVPKSDDEIRSLTLAFEKMLGNMKSIIRNIDDNFEETNESVHKMKLAAEYVSDQATAIGRTVHDISSGAESSSNAIQQTAESVEESTQLASQVQEKANQSKQKSSDMVNVLNESKKVIHNMVNGIQNLSVEQEASLEDVERLETNAKEVEKIISLVGEIAEQTNLLALNASIEAARAGEHGKGFAVVAEEVRKLADESATAVQGISDLIDNIQRDVKQVVGKIGKHVEFAREEAGKGQQSNAAIQQMSESINEVASAIDAITILVDKQMVFIQNTAQQSQEVSAIAEETSAGAQEVDASIQEQAAMIQDVEHLAVSLENQAKALKKEIHRFRLT
ncbi:methyl-accepting chemotaxis protein [Thalassobacillus hwangdonensis]|uniref:Methyl-accepting chemotaxis protein n=1 Tax=Thalassobacillus hwangdonensis TaxID=546108 RepID=A0ABW3L3U1_9BACI